MLMEKSVQHFCDQISAIRSGAITPSVIDTVRVPYYGQPTPIGHMATTIGQGNRITITPYDPSVLGQIDKSLKEAGFNSYVFSKTAVVVTVASIGGFEIDKVIKQINKLAEEAKIAIRNIRKKAKQVPAATEDEKIREDREIQRLTDKYVEEINVLRDRKLSEGHLRLSADLAKIRT